MRKSPQTVASKSRLAPLHELAARASSAAVIIAARFWLSTGSAWPAGWGDQLAGYK